MEEWPTQLLPLLLCSLNNKNQVERQRCIDSNKVVFSIYLSYKTRKTGRGSVVLLDDRRPDPPVPLTPTVPPAPVSSLPRHFASPTSPSTLIAEHRQKTSLLTYASFPHSHSECNTMPPSPALRQQANPGSRAALGQVTRDLTSLFEGSPVITLKLADRFL